MLVTHPLIAEMKIMFRAMLSFWYHLLLYIKYLITFGSKLITFFTFHHSYCVKGYHI